MPLYPDHFDYLATDSHSTAFTSTFTGVLAIQRLLEQKSDYWVTEQAQQKTHKALLFTDWTFPAWSDLKRLEFEKKLEGLYEAGFKVYVWNRQGELQALPPGTNLSELMRQHLLPQMPVHPNTCLATIQEQLKLTADQVQFLDDYEIDCLLDPSTRNNPRTLSCTALEEMTPRQKLQVIQTLQKATPPLASLFYIKSIQNPDKNFDPQTKNLLRLLPNPPTVEEDATNVVQAFPTVTPSSDAVKQLIYSNDSPFTLEENLPVYKNAESIVFTHFDPTEPQKILQIYALLKGSKIKELAQFDFYLKGDITKDIEEALSQISHLNLMATENHTPEEFATMISLCKNLELLELLNFTEEDLQNIPENSIRHLKAGTPVKNSLHRVLTQSKHLKILELAPHKDMFASLQEHDLDTLEELVIKKKRFFSKKQGPIRVENLHAALKNAKNLKKISYKGVSYSFKWKGYRETFDTLQELRITHSNTTFQEIDHILSHAPQLRTLKLKLDVDNYHYQRYNLPELVNLTIKNTNYNSVGELCFYDFLQNSKNINSIDFENTTINFKNPPKDLQFKHLESLSFETIVLKASDLEYLLSISPNLKTLNLKHCIIDWENFNLDPKLLARLKHLSLHGLNTKKSPDILNTFLSNTPQLQTLECSGCTLKNSAPPSADSLPFLETLVLSDSSVTTPILEQFLQAGKNIISLKINDCTELNSSPLLDDNSLLNLCDINFKNSEKILTGSGIKNWCDAAPALNKAELLKEFEEYSKKQQVFKEHQDDAEDNTENRKDQPHDPKKMHSIEKLRIAEKYIPGLKTQGNIIHALIAFKKLQGQPFSAVIEDNIKGGVCHALSRFFKEQPNSFVDFFHKVFLWDRQTPATPPLSSYFQILESYINTIYLYDIYKIPRDTTPNVYVGDHLHKFIARISQPNTPLHTSYIIKNPWHAIAISKVSATDFMVYDPNYLHGPKIVPHHLLQQTLHTQIGRCLSVEMTLPTDIQDILQLGDQPHQDLITNTNRFLEEGGLFILTDKNYHNQDNVLSILMQRLQHGGAFSEKALEGILLRSTSTYPAWFYTLRSANPEIVQLTHTLLEQFVQKYPNHKKRLVLSLSTVPELAKKDFLNALYHTDPQLFKFIYELIGHSLEASTYQDIHTLFLKNFPQSIAPTSLTTIDVVPLSSTTNIAAQHATQYKKYLTTWEQSTDTAKSALEYCHHCLAQDPTDKKLIFIKNTEALEALHWQFIHAAEASGRPIFYVNSPEDLQCSAPYIQARPDGTGEAKRGPGGPLYRFLKAHQDKSPILLVNYDNFTKSEIIAFNALIDTPPSADKTLLPPHTRVIGLMNPHAPTAYQEADFYSRFERNIAVCPLTQAQLNERLPTLRVMEYDAEDHAGLPHIGLYHQSNWKEKLLGTWVLKQGQLQFEKGLLASIPDDSSVVIEQGLWKSQEFRNFWLHLKTHADIEHAGVKIQLPRNLQLIRKDTYDETLAQTYIQHKENSTAAITHFLNPSLFPRLYAHYTYTDGQLQQNAGLLAEVPPHTRIAVQVTRDLSQDQWAAILETCKQRDLLLECHTPPAIKQPLPFNTQHPWSNTPSLIHSTDPDATIAYYLQEDTNILVIDLSEINAAQLLTSIDAKLNPTTLDFQFSEKKGALATALAQGKKVILTGKYSPESLDQLLPLLHSEQAKNLKVLTKDPAPFVHQPYAQHTVTPEDKKALFSQLNPLKRRKLEPYYHEPYTKIRARLTQQEPWAGLHQLTNTSSHLDWETINNPEHVRQFTEQRLKAIQGVLEHEPYVFIAGLSGVGKSSFIEQEFSRVPNVTLYHGEKALESWARDHNAGKRKVLFLDEANLTHSDWSCFEGLYNTPPTIILNGILHTLTPEHKVIFAGNPLSYGSERKLPALFERHGNAVVFDFLPPAVLYEKILAPVFKGTKLAEHAEDISSYILMAYQLLCHVSTTEVLISPRELQMMALLILSAHTKNPTLKLDTLIKDVIARTAGPLMPAEHQEKFYNLFEPQKISAATFPALGNFHLTPSRLPAAQYIQERLDLRELRTKSRNPTVQTGGLGGIILEGEPGCGKSELVTALLVANGYHEYDYFDPNQKHDKAFCRIPASMRLEDKKRLLIEAFHAGAVVVMDEINSSPMMEQLLNALLMGKTLENEPAKNPGFMLIGTQNPVSMTGRRLPSTALSRRVTTVEVPEYPDPELFTLLTRTGVPVTQADEMVMAYREQYNYAKANNLKPQPTFRDLQALAEVVKKAHATMPSGTPAALFLSSSSTHLQFGQTVSQQPTLTTTRQPYRPSSPGH